MIFEFIHIGVEFSHIASWIPGSGRDRGIYLPIIFVYRLRNESKMLHATCCIVVVVVVVVTSPLSHAVRGCNSRLFETIYQP